MCTVGYGDVVPKSFAGKIRFDFEAKSNNDIFHVLGSDILKISKSTDISPWSK